MPKKYWLVKSEPDVYSFDDLVHDKTTAWTGVRNYAARNFMRDQMAVGDGVLYYHSNAKPKAIVGTAEIVKTGIPDATQFDKKSEYHDPKSDPAAPTWITVEVKAGKPFKTPVTLEMVKATEALSDMVLVNNSRLSVQPVTAAEWKIILGLAGE